MATSAKSSALGAAQGFVVLIEGHIMIELKMSVEEAQVLVELLGDVKGAGPKREACDALYGRLTELLTATEGPLTE
jgi:hypothetical protein